MRGCDSYMARAGKYKKVFSLSLQSGYRNYTVRDLLETKGKKKLTQINVTTPEEAAAAEEAGIDLIIAGPPSPMKKIREAAPKTFFHHPKTFSIFI